MTDLYRFEYRGAPMVADIDLADMPTTTAAPNLRVIAGSWSTWRLEITRPEGLPAEARQFRCVDPSDPSKPHPRGNLTAAESASDIDVLMVREDGYVCRAAVGEAALWPWRDQAYRDAFQARLNA